MQLFFYILHSRKKFVFSFLVAFLKFNTLVFSQNFEIKEKERVIPLEWSEFSKKNDVEEDTLRVNFLIRSSSECQKKNIQKSIQLSEEALAISERIKWHKGIANSSNKLGIYFQFTGNYSNCFYYYFKALKLREIMGDKSGMANVLGNIGNAYFLQKNYTKAIEYLLQSLKMNRSLNKQLEIAKCLGNIANVYAEQGELEKALNYQLQDLEIVNKLGNKRGICDALSNIGNVYEMKGNYSLALKYYLNSLAICDQNENKRTFSRLLENIGLVYFEQKNFKDAEVYYKRALGIAKEISYLELKEQVHNDLSELYVAQNRWSMAMQEYKSYIAIRDSMFNAASLANIVEIETKYETEKREQENVLLSKQNVIQALDIKRGQYLTLGLACIFILIVIIIIFGIRQNKLRIRSEKLDYERKLLISKSRMLRAQMNPHFIFNCMASIQSFIMQNDRDSSFGFLSKFARLIRATLENSELEYITLDREVRAITDYIQLETLRFEDKFSYTITIAKEINAEIAKIPSMLIQPYVENSIIHGLSPKKDGKGKLEINFEMNDNTLICQIIDNGIGRKAAKVIKDKMNLSHKSLGTSITEERLALMAFESERKVSVSVIDLEDADYNARGTIVELKIPTNRK